MARRVFSTGVAACLAAGVGLWCTRASLDVIETAHGVTRIAMLPSWPDLVGGTCAVLLAVCLASLGAAKLAHSGWSWLRVPTHPTSDLVVPFFLLLGLLLPFLPWLPDWMPALRALGGPLASGVWVVVLLAMCWLVWDSRPHTATIRAAAPVSRGATAVVFALSLTAYGGAAMKLAATTLYPGGDEPHYLVMTQSLLTDGDLRIENNHARGDYKAYYRNPLNPDYRTRGQNGQIYSIHPIGLPILITPAFAAGGYLGVCWMLAVLAAAAATLAWRAAASLTASAASATLAWMTVALSAPVVLHSFAVYPETTAGLCALIALWWGGREQPGTTAEWIGRGVAVALLPWLGTKYAPMSAVIVLALSRRAWKAGGLATAAAVAVPYAVSVWLWFGFFYVVWGSPLPSAPYGPDHQTAFANLIAGFPGVLVDQEYGVLPYAPAIALAFPGLWVMWRDGGARRERAIETGAAFLALMGTVGAFAIWWGGSAPPGRELVAGLVLLAPPLARWDQHVASAPVRRWILRLLAIAGVVITATLVIARNGLLIANGRDGMSEWLEWLQPTRELVLMVPSGIAGRDAPGPFLLQVALCIAIALAGSYIARRLRYTGGRAVVAAGLVLGTAAIIASLVVPLAGRPASEVLTVPSARAEIPLIREFDARRRPLAVVYDPLTRLAPEAVPARFAIEGTPGLRVSPQPIRVLLNMRVALPAGTYRVLLEPRPGATLAGPLGLQVGRIGDVLETWDVTSASGSPWSHPFELAVDANFVAFRGSPALEASLARIAIDPLTVENESDRPALPPVLGAARYRHVTAYFHSQGVYTEPAGFWVRARSTAVVTFAHDGTAGQAAGIRLRLHSGDAATRVTLQTSDWQTALNLTARAAQEVVLPARPGDAVVSARIAPQGGFVPADHGGSDRRELGCWVEVVE